jgi:hypothetical protein
MSGEDDNFDIDIYGDEEEQQQQQQQAEADDFDYNYEETQEQSGHAEQSSVNNGHPVANGGDDANDQRESHQPAPHTANNTQQNLKRKAPDDETEDHSQQRPASQTPLARRPSCRSRRPPFSQNIRTPLVDDRRRRPSLLRRSKHRTRAERDCFRRAQNQRQESW